MALMLRSLAAGLLLMVNACDEKSSGSHDFGSSDSKPAGLGFAVSREFAVGSAPSSLAAADLDGDGHLDVVVTNRKANTLSILGGFGDGTFKAQSTLQTPSEPTRVRVADLNGDTRLDLAAACFSDSMVVFLAQASGGFGAAKSYLVATETNDLALADVNLDGKLDLAAAKIGVIDSTTIAVPVNDVALFLGSGTGSLGARMGVGPSAPASAIAVGDLNRDGKPDLIIVLWLDEEVRVFLGRGDGTFQAGSTQPLPNGSDPQAAALDDFDGDGSPDVAVADALTADVSILSGRGDGTLDAVTRLSVGGKPSSVEAWDMDGDGRLDLVVATGSGVAVSLGNGDGTFKAPAIFPAGSTPLYATAGDFNHDGRLDLVVANSGSNDVSVLLAASR